jgi:hypothetical protein
MIKKFETFNGKSIAVYHGYGGEPAPDRIKFLESVGFSKIHYPYIDFDGEWELDKCKSLFERELESLKNIDLLIGVSLGGYLAFELAGYLSKDLVLINPGLDRNKTKLDINFFDIEPMRKFGKIETFLGSEDKLIDKLITLQFFEENKINSDIKIIDGMEHRLPLNYFIEIYNKSKLLKQ